jgi:hypothetical protein
MARMNHWRSHVLHTRTTAPRSLRNGKRDSRRFFLTVCGAATIAALAACGSDKTTTGPPPPPAVAGDYSLLSVDGKAPPDTVINTSAETVVFLDGLLSLHSDATYKLLFHSTSTTSSGTVADSSGSTGTYTVNGNTVVIHNSSTGDSVVATAALPTISFTDGNEVFVFSK